MSELSDIPLAALAARAKSDAASALALRRRVRSSFLDWCIFVEANRTQVPALHHRLIINTLERVVAGEIKNVMLLMPPGAAKSTYTSVNYPPYYLARHPHSLILACSYSYTLIEGFGRRCRDLISNHQHLLGYTLSRTASASGDWRIRAEGQEDGGYFCAGVGSGIAGHRADLGFIDDYLGSQEDADSELIRDKQWDWYWNDFWPRLKPQAAQVLIANRRHEDDLVGRLLKDERQEWTVIRLPYFAEENDPLGRPCSVHWNEQSERMEYDLRGRIWPDWFDEKHARKIMQMDARVLAGLYQQRPTPEEGNFFKRNMLVPYSFDDLRAAESSGMRYYVGSDFAVRKGQENDRYCFITCGVDTSDRIWILPDWWWTRASSDEAVEAMIAMCRRRRPLTWWAGREAITGVLEPFILKRSRETNVYVPIEELSEARDKVAKSQAIKARMSQKMVLFPKFAPSWNEAESELLSFPGGTHDDFVDALAKLGQGLDTMVKAYPSASEPKDIAGYKFTPTLGWLKRAHEAQLRFQRQQELDK